MKVTIIGAGSGGASAVAELTRAGHEVALWNRSPATLEPFQKIGGVEYEGILGEGFAKPALITTDLAAAIRGAEAVVCTLPTFSHVAVAGALAAAGMDPSVPVVLNPGHTGGALEFTAAWRAARPGAGVPPVADFNSLTYIARKYQPQRVTTTGRARFLRAGCLPGGDKAVEVAMMLFPGVQRARDVLEVGLANPNMILHPPGAILGACWVEARKGDFTFYVEGMTPGVARVMKALDDERRAVARAFGHELPSVIGEMKKIGSVEASVTNEDDFVAAIAGGEANKRIAAPDSLGHRYYLEDFGHGLLPFMAFAGAAGVAVPTAAALFELGVSLTGTDYRAKGRTAATMGIAGLDRAGILSLVRGK